MRAQCIAAVSKAAGRQITAAEADGIESRIRANLRQLAIKDPQGFAALPVGDRLDLAAKAAADQLNEDVANAKRQAQAQIAVHARVGAPSLAPAPHRASHP